MRRARRDLVQQVEVDLEGGDRAVDVPLARYGRVQLAYPAELALVAGQHGGGAAGMQEGALARLEPRLDAGRCADRLEQCLGGVEVRGARSAAPGAGQRLGKNRGEVMALVRGCPAGGTALGRLVDRPRDAVGVRR